MNKFNDEIINKMKNLLFITADKTRLKIMLSLLDESKCRCDDNKQCEKCTLLECMIEMCVNDVCKIVGISQSLASHQLKVLRDANLVKVRKDGLKRYYSLKDNHIKILLNVALGHVNEEVNKND